jgi:hypothetical protein
MKSAAAASASEIPFEHRLPDGTLNHLRFAADGTIYLQREVTQPEDNSAAKAGIKMDKDGNIEIKAEGNRIDVICKTMTINGELVVTDGANRTTIKGNEITGA